MTDILLERVSIKERNWVRTHATDTEGSAICSNAIHEEMEAVELGESKVTCPDCIETIKKCKGISDTDLQPEYDNELLWKR